MTATLERIYETVSTPYGKVKRERWICSNCKQKYNIKYVSKCKKCGAELEKEPVNTWPAE